MVEASEEHHLFMGCKMFGPPVSVPSHLFLFFFFPSFKFKRYSEFFSWKLETFALNIGGRLERRSRLWHQSDIYCVCLCDGGGGVGAH